jgi:hypothetical protein
MQPPPTSPLVVAPDLKSIPDSMVSGAVVYHALLALAEKAIGQHMPCPPRGGVGCNAHHLRRLCLCHA